MESNWRWNFWYHDVARLQDYGIFAPPRTGLLAHAHGGPWYVSDMRLLTNPGQVILVRPPLNPGDMVEFLPWFDLFNPNHRFPYGIMVEADSP